MKLQAEYREAGCLHLEHDRLPAELHGNCAPSEGGRCVAEPARLRVMDDVTRSDVDGGVLTFKGWLPLS